MIRPNSLLSLAFFLLAVVSQGAVLTPGGGGGGGAISGSITGAYSFSAGFTTASATNVSMLPAISNLAINAAFTNASMIFSNVLTLNPTSTTPRLNGMHLTNQAARARVGDTIQVSPGTYWSPTNVFSVLRNGVNWDVAEGATLIFGTTGDESDYNIPFNDWSGAVTSYISGAGTFIVSNNLANLLNLTNSASRVIWHAKEIRAANEQAAIMQGHPNDVSPGGGKLWVYASDGIYADGYDAYINQHNPNSAQTFIYTSRLVGDTTAGDSAFEATVAYANPGDCIVRAGYARGDFTLTDNMDVELGTLDLGANNVLYSPLAQQGNGVLRNTYVYGTSNRTTSLISTPSDSGLFATHGTFIQCVFVGSTNRPLALITNDNGRATTFIASRFWDGFGATNSIRSKNAQKVVLIGTDTPLGLHANVTASTSTNHTDQLFKELATFELGIDVFSDLNANGQLNAGDFTTTGAAIIGGTLEIPTGASSGYVLTSDGSGVATWAAPTGGSGGGTNFPNVNLLLGNTNLVLSAGVRKAFHNQTNGSHGINLNLAVPESGYEVTYSVSNSSASDITVTFYTNSVAANPYDISSKTNVNTFTASASAITKATLQYKGSGIWELDSVKGPASILKFGSGITATTNGVNGLDVTISASGGYTLFGSSAANNMTLADSTTYYAGLELNTSMANMLIATNVQIYIPRTGTLKSGYVHYRVASTLGTSELVTNSFYNVTTATASAGVTAALNSASVNVTMAGLSLAVTAGDFVTLRIETPAWVTNPLSTTVAFQAWIE